MDLETAKNPFLVLLHSNIIFLVLKVGVLVHVDPQPGFTAGHPF